LANAALEPESTKSDRPADAAAMLHQALAPQHAARMA
jgi:hypothetical protein